MKIKHTKTASYILTALTVITITLKPCFALSDKKAFVFYGTNKQDLSTAINEYVLNKSKRIYKKNIKIGLYHFQPKYFMANSDDYYITLALKDNDSNLVLYTQNDVLCSDKLDAVLKYLNKQGFSFETIKDKYIINLLSNYTEKQLNNFQLTTEDNGDKDKTKIQSTTKNQEIKVTDKKIQTVEKSKQIKLIEEVVQKVKETEIAKVQPPEAIPVNKTQTGEKPKQIIPTEEVVQKVKETEIAKVQPPRAIPVNKTQTGEKPKQIKPTEEVVQKVKETEITKVQPPRAIPVKKSKPVEITASKKVETKNNAGMVEISNFSPLPVQIQKTIHPTKIDPNRKISPAGEIYNKTSNGVVTVLAGNHGSGFLVDKRGLILTNFHVVQEQKGMVKVRFGHNKVVKAKIMATDIKHDLAVLWVNLKNIQDYSILKLFHSNEPLALFGEQVISIGGPITDETMEKTLTHGIVSKLNNDIIWHDSKINEGNFGGPLLNYNAEVIGINTLIQSNKGGALSAAITIDKAFGLVDKVQNILSEMSEPPAELQPDAPRQSYSFRLMQKAFFTHNKQALEDRKRTESYYINTKDYDIYIITPPQKYRKLAQQELEFMKKYKKRMEKSGKELSEEAYVSKTFSDYEYNKPVVQVFITPQAHFQYKRDFASLELKYSNTMHKLEPIKSGKKVLTQAILNELGFPNSIEINDKSYLGYYEYNPKIFNTKKGLLLNIKSIDESDPIALEIPQKIKDYITADFQPYWDSIDTNNTL